MAQGKTGGAAIAAPPQAIEGAEMPDAFEPDRLYDVQLHTAFSIGHVVMNPADAQTLKGDICEANRDKIWRAVLNEWGVQELT